jgi:hypothetical protein
MKLVVPTMAALLFAVSGGTAFAVHETPFSQLDRNQDGVISRDEASGKLADDYANADENRDGVVNQSEFSAFEVRTEDFSNPVVGPGGLGITEEYQPGRAE